MGGVQGCSPCNDARLPYALPLSMAASDQPRPHRGLQGPQDAGEPRLAAVGETPTKRGDQTR